MGGLTWAAAGFLGAVLLFVLNSLFVPLIQKDLEEGVPWLAAWLVRRAAHKLPAKHQERFEEEWLAELTAIPGVMVFKLRFALGVTLRVRATSRAMQGLPPWWEEVLRRLAQVMTRTSRPYVEAARKALRNRVQKGNEVDPIELLWRPVRMLIDYLAPESRRSGETKEGNVHPPTASDANARGQVETSPETPSSRDPSVDLRIRTLSVGEREILGLLVNGRSNRQIAEECFLSLETVRAKVQDIIVKLGVDSRVEAAAFAYRHQVVDLIPMSDEGLQWRRDGSTLHLRGGDVADRY
jgi:DNA-binding NarL/FixJ family response regulator